ncbi:ROK family glucokinase [Bailinhaonella thermotolerans]|uniref:Glucokinase n=1 Tax=Bailinhaonella thermotolerans TaxID=1070861 RepID=A0A3A4BB26_9ACTN|nr:ROK family glucokinase [Bailinhaonella thermotolerans]RJL31408.1 ROK family protein [Bailinhaonella thermotolerans]
MGLTIGVDVGGTKVAGGVVDEDGHMVDNLKLPTPSNNVEQISDTIATVVQRLGERHRVEAVGIGAAGFVDETRSVVRFAPNLAWREEPLRKKVQDRIDLPVVVENDANAMAWGEARFGAGRGQSHLVCLTVGTGIGGGIVLDGRLYRGRWGMGAEMGHLTVVPGGRLCGCGNRGCWEQYASGNALVENTRELMRAEPLRADRLLELGDGTPEGVTGPEITSAALEGDVLALEAFRILGDWLGQGLADIAAMLDPACFVIGGGVSEAGELLLEPARKTFSESLTARSHRPLAEIRVAELGAEAGVIGAADLARQR